MSETVTVTKPAPIIEGALTSFLEPIKKLQPGTIPAGGFTGIDTTKFAPTIAAESQLQQDARTAAGGLGTLVGPQAFQPFMSPYQQEVIDTTLAEFDRQAAINQTANRDRAIQAGAYGGAREGIMAAEFDARNQMQRAGLQAQLLQQGFQQAQQARGQDFERQRGLASMVPGLQRQDIQTLGSVGAGQQAQEQAKLDAQREAARQATFLPQENLSRYAGQVAGLMGGYPGQTTSSNVPNPSPLQNALTMGTGLAGIYGSLTGKY